MRDVIVESAYLIKFLMYACARVSGRLRPELPQALRGEGAVQLSGGGAARLGGAALAVARVHGVPRVPRVPRLARRLAGKAHRRPAHCQIR